MRRRKNRIDQVVANVVVTEERKHGRKTDQNPDARHGALSGSGAGWRRVSRDRIARTRARVLRRTAQIGAVEIGEQADHAVVVRTTPAARGALGPSGPDVAEARTPRAPRS
jgi:hypothetical protein